MKKNKIPSIIKENKKNILLSALFDFIFAVVFIITYFSIVVKVFDILQEMSTLLDTISDYTSLQVFSQSVEFYSLYQSLILWLVLLAISTFAIWIVFQSASFWLGLKLFREKLHFWEYFKKFTIYSLFYYLIILGAFYLGIYLSILNSRLPIPIFPQTVINIIIGIIILITMYFAGITLFAVSKHKLIDACKATLRISFKRFLKSVIYFIIPLLGLIFSVLILYVLASLHIMLLYAGFVLLFIPAITFFRITYFYYMSEII